VTPVRKNGAVLEALAAPHGQAFAGQVQVFHIAAVLQQDSIPLWIM
jgi:hypothetical protein